MGTVKRPAVVGRVSRRMLGALLAVAEAVETTDDADVLAGLFRMLDHRRDPKGMTQQLAMVRDACGAKLHQHIVGHPNRKRVFPGVGMLEATWAGSSEAWDGVRLARAVAARAVDIARVDPLTGEVREEPMPPAALAQFVADEIVACAGLDAKSKSWRTTDLKGRGFDPKDYRTFSGERRDTTKFAT